MSENNMIEKKRGGSVDDNGCLTAFDRFASNWKTSSAWSLLLCQLWKCFKWGSFFTDDLKVAATSDERFNFDTIFYWISILLPWWLKTLITTPMMMMLAENVEILTRTWVGRCRPTASKVHTWLLCWLFSQLLLSLFYSSICPTFNLRVFISRMALLIFLPYVFACGQDLNIYTSAQMGSLLFNCCLVKFKKGIILHIEDIQT